MIRALATLVILSLAAMASLRAAHAAEPVVIGSKNFTESVVLGEVARLAAQEHGIDVQHRRSLGGTRILWRALMGGDIEAYPEYTGTITHELLHDVPPSAGIAVLRAHLKKLRIGITDPLGFNNTYAIGMREDEARKLHIRSITDLAQHPDLKLAFSNEFMNRADGWPGLRDAYHLPMAARGMDHDLAYRALAAGAVDAIDLYGTDAEIAYYHLRVLDDDLHYFPRYDAVYLYRLDLQKRAPQFVAVLNGLAGSIDAQQMRAMNKAVKIDGKSETSVAANFLGVAAEAGSGGGFWGRMGRYTLQHLALVGISLSLAIVVAVPLGVFAARWRRLGQVVLGLTGILQTVPSLALFVFMIPLFGIGAEPAIAALFLYSLLPIVRNTHAGLTSIQPSLLESAAALGLPPRVRLWRVELPLALRHRDTGRVDRRRRLRPAHPHRHPPGQHSADHGRRDPRRAAGAGDAGRVRVDRACADAARLAIARDVVNAVVRPQAAPCIPRNSASTANTCRSSAPSSRSARASLRT